MKHTKKKSSPVAMEFKKQALIDALEKSMGVVTVACKKVGVSRKTFYEYYNNDATFREAYNDLKNVALDFAESKLYNRIEKESDACLIFYLKTQGKARGYIERMEHTGAEGNPIQLQINVTDAKTKAIIEQFDKL
jgi:hypothetical protein